MSICDSISFVVQGPIRTASRTNEGYSTERCIYLLRHWFPKSEIVLSTWEGEACNFNGIDILVKTPDPGGFVLEGGIPYNVNRQIASTKRGLERSTRPLCVKMRSDCVLFDDTLLSLLSVWLESDIKGSLFKRPLLCCDLFFRDPARLPLLFHIGDVFQAGLRDDLLRLWSIPAAAINDISIGPFTKRSGSNPLLKWNYPAIRYVPEQYIWVTFLNSVGKSTSLSYLWEMEPDLLRQSESSISKNFQLLTTEELGLAVPSKFLQFMDYSSVYTNERLQAIRAGQTQERLTLVTKRLRWEKKEANRRQFKNLARKLFLGSV